MGDITGAPIVNFKLFEPATGVLPSDDVGTLPDLDADGVTNSRPPVELSGVTGFARVFDGATPTGLEGADVDDLLRLTRSVTIQFIVRFDIAAQDAAGTPGTVVALGFRDASPDEDLQLLVELDVVDLATRNALVRMRWEDGTGLFESGNIGAEFFVPVVGGDDGAVLITVVREWRSDTEVIVRYYGNDIFLGSETSSDGDIGGEPGALFMLGVRGDGAGGYENYLEGALEAIVVNEFVMTAEEIRQIFRRGAVHGPEQYEVLKSLLPKNVYSNDPSSIVQRELFVEAQGMAQVVSKIFEIREDFLPDRAWSFLERWETVLALIPLPNDILADRRNRLLSFLRTVQGFSLPGVKLALESTFDLDSVDIQIIEFTHTMSDDFAVVLADFWQLVDTFAGNSVISAGELVIESQSGFDHRWSQSEAPHVKAVIDRDELDDDPALDTRMRVLIDNEVFTVNDETICGLAFIDQVTNDLAIFGFARIGGVTRLARATIVGGIEVAIVDVAVRPAGQTQIDFLYEGAGVYRMFSTNSIGSDNPTDQGTFTGPTDPGMVAIGCFGFVAGGPTADNSAEFDDFEIYTPNGLRVFNWYAFRDLLLPGSPDVPGANAVVKRIKPAHTQAAAISDLVLLCDSDGSLCDDGPLG